MSGLELVEKLVFMTWPVIGQLSSILDFYLFGLVLLVDRGKCCIEYHSKVSSEMYHAIYGKL